MSPISRKDGNKFDDPVSDGNHIRVILAGRDRVRKSNGETMLERETHLYDFRRSYYAGNKKSTLETVGFAVKNFIFPRA